MHENLMRCIEHLERVPLHEFIITRCSIEH